MQIESTTNGTMAEVILKLVFAFPLLSLSIDWLIDVKGESTLDTTRHALAHLPSCLISNFFCLRGHAWDY